MGVSSDLPRYLSSLKELRLEKENNSSRCLAAPEAVKGVWWRDAEGVTWMSASHQVGVGCRENEWCPAQFDVCSVVESNRI